MRSNHWLPFVAAVFLVCAATRAATAGDLAGANPEVAQKARRAVERGLVLLEQDAAAWRKERQCSTCHHGTMTVWAYMETKSQGHARPDAHGTGELDVFDKEMTANQAARPRGKESISFRVFRRFRGSPL